MASATPITDPDRVREWAEARGGRPACVKGTTALLRIDFGEPDEKLQPISWDQWTETFERRKLAALIQEDDERSRFFKLVDRRTAGGRAGVKSGRAGTSRTRKSTSKRAAAPGRKASAGTGRKKAAAKGRKASLGAGRKTASRSMTRKSAGKKAGSAARSGSAKTAGRGARAAGGGRGRSATRASSRKR